MRFRTGICQLCALTCSTAELWVFERRKYRPSRSECQRTKRGTALFVWPDQKGLLGNPVRRQHPIQLIAHLSRACVV
jgi:hypothetical protein